MTELRFLSKDLSVHTIIHRIKSTATVFLRVKEKKASKKQKALMQGSHTAEKWYFPGKDWIKVNYDGSFDRFFS